MTLRVVMSLDMLIKPILKIKLKRKKRKGISKRLIKNDTIHMDKKYTEYSKANTWIYVRTYAVQSAK